jgi:hypothetical protein
LHHFETYAVQQNFDYFVGTAEQRQREGDVERPVGLRLIESSTFVAC